MNLTFGRIRLFVVAAVSALAFAGPAGPALASDVPTGPAERVLAPLGVSEAEADRYIVVFREAALASYDGSVPGYARPAKLAGRNRIDVRSESARRYVSYLESRQAEHVTKVSAAVGRPFDVSFRMQHALNAVVTTLSAEEAAAVARLPEVLLVDPVRDVPMDTDVGPTLIGAPPLWTGSSPASAVPVQGEGTVIGVIDSGINFGSPSFAAVDPIDGYVHANPLGAGIYLGTCAAGGVDAGRCNAKLVGGYDFVCAAPGNACGVANVREEPGFGDTNGHGSHTASTVAGNRRDLAWLGMSRRISGVAPRANVIAYDVCYTNTSTSQGLCPTASSAAAVNQAIADGVVDAINFSIGGGTSPWSDSVSLAFLAATDAGIYVATSAGNDGPAAYTLGHLEPWTASTAAAQHGRSGFTVTLNVTGPSPVPPALAAVAVNPGSLGAGYSAPIAAPFIASPTYAAANDGCAAYPAGTFTRGAEGAIALVRRGTCGFAVKVSNAAAAGAVAVIIANNAAAGLIPVVEGTTIPAFGASQADGTALQAFAVANATATATIPAATVGANTPDQLASFSSRGPANAFDLVKPDVTAPGVSVLATVAGTTISGSENAVALYDGTSMASPHNAGASLLLRQLRPTWSVPEIKSALEMTAKRTVLKEDGATAATPFDMGGGRIRVDRAANAGLVLHETTANFTAANPSAGGSPSTLNLPSIARQSCVGSCQFVRTFRNPHATGRTWNAALLSLAGTVSPATFTVAAGGTVALTIAIDTTSITPNGAFNFGWLQLLPAGGPAEDELTLPIAIAVPPPVITLVPPSQDVALYEGLVGSAAFDVRNDGGYHLDFAVDQTGQGLTSVYRADASSTSGYRSSIYTDPATAGAQAAFAADDITLAYPTTITSILGQGGTLSGAALTSVATQLVWAIYPDASGLPAGNPQTNPGAAVWSYTAAPTAAGVSTPGNGIRLDLPAAGQSLTLTPGRYWVVVAARLAFANRWLWVWSTTGSGSFATITISSTGTGSWAANPTYAGLALQVEGTVACGAPWIGSSTPANGVVAGGAAQTIATDLSAVGVTAGTYYGSVCVANSDPLRPKVAEVLRLTVTAPPPGTASRLVFTTPPSATGNAGTPWAQQPVVTAQDVGGVTVAGYATPVTLSLASGTGTLTCDFNPVVPVAGVATFAGCRIDAVGAYTLRATSGAIPDSTTHPAVAISAGAATQLVFTTPPSATGTAGTAWAQQPVVTVQDAFANTVTGHATPVALVLASGSGAITCDANPVTPVAGVATFTGCRIDSAGPYTLGATSGAIANSTTNPPIVIAAAAASQLLFTTPPSSIAMIGTPFEQQPVVTIRDAFGNTAPGYTTPVTLTLATGTGTLTCDANPVTPVDGVAAFTGCRLDTAGTFTLSATSGAFTSATPNPQVSVLDANGMAVVPALGTLGFLVLGALLGLAGFLVLRRPV